MGFRWAQNVSKHRCYAFIFNFVRNSEIDLTSLKTELN